MRRFLSGSGWRVALSHAVGHGVAGAAGVVVHAPYAHAGRAFTCENASSVYLLLKNTDTNCTVLLTAAAAEWFGPDRLSTATTNVSAYRWVSRVAGGPPHLSLPKFPSVDNAFASP